MRAAALLLALLAPTPARAQELASQDPLGRALQSAAEDAQLDARFDGALRAALGASLASFSLLAPEGAVALTPRVLGAAVGGVVLASGAVEFFGTPLLASLASDLDARLGAGLAPGDARAQTERVWQSLAQREARLRRVSGWLAVGLSAALVTATALAATDDDPRAEHGYAVGYGLAAAAAGAWAIGLLVREGPAAAALRGWRASRPDLAVAPWGAGGVIRVRF